MTIIVDSRERLKEVLGAADGQRLLEYAGENGETFSYDVEVTTTTGQVVKVERKALRSDAVQSWLDGKLPRQLSAVDLFCVELPDMFELAAEPYSQVEQNFLKHLEYVKLSVAVWETGGPADTMQRLRWLSERKDGLAIRANRIEGRDSRENARQAIIRAIMAGSGHSPDRKTADGRTVGQQLESRIDWEEVAIALDIEPRDVLGAGWLSPHIDWSGRRPSEAALRKMRERVWSSPHGDLPGGPT